MKAKDLQDKPTLYRSFTEAGSNLICSYIMKYNIVLTFFENEIKGEWNSIVFC